MSVQSIVGNNWGDEGKGKMVDYLSGKADIVVRFQGGNNAGHTVINHYGKFSLHLLPSGVFYSNVLNVLATGVALNIKAFAEELHGLTERGVPKPKIAISDRAQVVLPYHILFDIYEEERLADKKFGSTKSGIAPFYSDKYYKTGIQVADLYDKALLKDKLEKTIDIKNILLKNLYFKPLINIDDLVEELYISGKLIEEYVCDTTLLLNKAIKENKKILLEGQLGALKDIDHGIYPFTTSSSTLAGYGSVSSGIPPYEIKSILSIIKSYSSCVGEGPFVTEIFGNAADELRNRGGDNGEFGATTGRPRRMGWFDVVATRYGCMLQGATEAALTLLDVLSYLDEIPICISYEIDNELVNSFPNTSKLYRAKPVYTTLPGWKCDISTVKSFKDLPTNAQNYIKYIEEKIEVPITFISVGPKRDQTIFV